MTPEGGRVGRYIARWVPQHPGLYFAMTRANGFFFFFFFFLFFTNLFCLPPLFGIGVDFFFSESREQDSFP